MGGQRTGILLRTLAISIEVFIHTGCSGPQIAEQAVDSIERSPLIVTPVEARLSAKRPQSITLAVLPFRNNTGDPALDALGSTLAELASNKMEAAPGLRLVERQRISDVLSELKLEMMGVTDPQTSLKVGKLIGVQRLVFGSFSVVDQATILTIRMVNVETGEILGGGSIRSDQKADLGAMAEDAAAKVRDAIHRD